MTIAAWAGVGSLWLGGLVAGCSSSSSSPASTGSPDAASVDPAAQAFVGQWARTGTDTVTCTGRSPNPIPITGTLVIALGSSSDQIVSTQPDGCVQTFTVTGKVASAPANQTCTDTTDAGPLVLTNQAHTLTLSADGQSIAESGTATFMDEKLACDSSSMGTFTKED